MGYQKCSIDSPLYPTHFLRAQSKSKLCSVPPKLPLKLAGKLYILLQITISWHRTPVRVPDKDLVLPILIKLIISVILYDKNSQYGLKWPFRWSYFQFPAYLSSVLCNQLHLGGGIMVGCPETEGRFNQKVNITTCKCFVL